MVATDAGVYVAADNKFSFLSGETGTESQSISVESTPAKKIKWMALSNGNLYALTGDTLADTSQYRYGDAISAYEASSGLQKWRKTFEKRIDSKEIGDILYNPSTNPEDKQEWDLKNNVASTLFKGITSGGGCVYVGSTNC